MFLPMPIYSVQFVFLHLVPLNLSFAQVYVVSFLEDVLKGLDYDDVNGDPAAAVPCV